MKSIVFLAVCICLMMSACYYDKAEELYPSNFNQNDTGAVTYTNYIAPLITSNCASSGCHATKFPILGDYPKLKTIIDNGTFKNRVMVQRNMPPGGLTASAYVKIQKWLDAGAPNN
jgi:hypothetical protein